MSGMYLENISIEVPFSKLKIDGIDVLAFVSFDVGAVIRINKIPLLCVATDDGFLLHLPFAPFECEPGRKPIRAIEFKSTLVRDDFTLTMGLAALRTRAKAEQND